jgi:hypothetical protein
MPSRRRARASRRFSPRPRTLTRRAGIRSSSPRKSARESRRTCRQPGLKPGRPGRLRQRPGGGSGSWGGSACRPRPGARPTPSRRPRGTPSAGPGRQQRAMRATAATPTGVPPRGRQPGTLTKAAGSAAGRCGQRGARRAATRSWQRPSRRVIRGSSGWPPRAWARRARRCSAATARRNGAGPRCSVASTSTSVANRCLAARQPIPSRTARQPWQVAPDRADHGRVHGPGPRAGARS